MDIDIKEEGKFKYIEEGEGESLILLHGLFGALSNYREVLDHFKTRFKVLIPLLPIYELPVLETNVKKLSKYLDQFIAHKGLGQVNLLGNSLGGHVALVYTAKHQDRVDRLILTGSSGLYENAMGGSFPRREDREFIKKKVAETFYDPKHATPDLVDECYDIINDKGKLIRILSLAKSAIRHNMAKELPEIKVPTCLIWGKNDNVTPPEVAEEFNQLLPNCKLYWIDQCGHAPMMEHPKTFNSHLDSWLAEHGN
ncbi:alpha/beta fold hydrolase [Luteibaculum oceani]|uniref:Alpha/beta hydrolase n=1 Tax=Luteibaculum oceani TaxID=1294296 RepID=A0A5C6UZM5_9FLAO|nr:alpha/beta hydrolase [Luteibaculum oceani]TXC78883.1 alpha/beta hydrolase [Luteibaculum oceani]